MTLLIVSFVAGMLTVLAPCILPLLPIIVGGSITDAHARWKPFIVTGSLALSVIAFTLLLKATTAFIDIPQQTWSTISGGILIIFGLITLFPDMWDKIAQKFKSGKANKILARGSQKKSVWGDIMIGAALGPVFSSCSPTYAVIVATVLPVSIAKGMIYLVAYVLGLSLILLLVAFIGQRLTKRLAGAANPKSLFKKVLGILFLCVGVAIFFGLEKDIEGRILDTGIYDGISGLEGKLIERVDDDDL